MTISEKVAYLKGLAEGLDLDTNKSKEGKLISVMIGILEEIGLSIEDLEENATALGEEIDAISDDLSDVEKAVFEDEDDDDFFEIECPNCIRRRRVPTQGHTLLLQAGGESFPCVGSHVCAVCDSNCGLCSIVLTP